MSWSRQIGRISSSRRNSTFLLLSSRRRAPKGTYMMTIWMRGHCKRGSTGAGESSCVTHVFPFERRIQEAKLNSEVYQERKPESSNATNGWLQEGTARFGFRCCSGYTVTEPSDTISRPPQERAECENVQRRVEISDPWTKSLDVGAVCSLRETIAGRVLVGSLRLLWVVFARWLTQQLVPPSAVYQCRPAILGCMFQI